MEHDPSCKRMNTRHDRAAAHPVCTPGEANSGASVRGKSPVTVLPGFLLSFAMLLPCSAEADPILLAGDREMLNGDVSVQGQFPALKWDPRSGGLIIGVAASGDTHRTQPQVREPAWTQEQILVHLAQLFRELRNVTPVGGRARRMGQSSDGMASIEIIGDPSDIHSATVAVTLPNDAPLVLKRNVLVYLVLIDNSLPDWPEGANWLTTAFKEIAASQGKTSKETTVGNAKVTLQVIKQVGLATLTIERLD